MAEQQARGIPTTTQEHGLRAALDHQGPMAIQPMEAGRSKGEAEMNTGLLLHQLLNVFHCLRLSPQTGHTQGQAIAGENFGKALANHSGNAPAAQGLGGMFAAGAAAEIAVDHQNPGPLMLGAIKGMASPRCSPVIGKDVVAQPGKADAFQEPGWNDAIRVDVMALEGDRPALRHGDRRRRHGSTGAVAASFGAPSMVRTSVTTPLTAAAATMAGLISKVRPEADP